MDTLYRYRFSVAKSSKCPNIREYSNCVAKSSKCPNIREYSNDCRLVHHQKSISQFPEKDGSVPCAEDGKMAEKINASFLFNLVVMITDDLLDCGGWV